MYWRTIVAPVLLAVLATSCGYSEEEWQAQLDKHRKEIAAIRQAGEARERKLHAEFEAEKQRVAELTKQLEAAGVDMGKLNASLQEAGATVSKLNATLEEREKALAEYRARAKQLEAIKARFEMLRRKLEELTKLGLAVNIRKNRMVISLPGDVLFDSGRESLKKEGQEILMKVAGIIKNDATLKNRDYQVAGHTDSKPLQGGIFRDNWGLSLMRAREVLLFLVSDKGGQLPLARWSASGFGDTDPVATNDTDEGRQKNRRCDLIVVPSVEEMLDLKAITKD